MTRSERPMPKARITLAAAALTSFALACAPGVHDPGPAAAAPPPAAATSPATASSRAPDPEDALCAPLLIEPDLGFGTHVVMRRLPGAADMDDLRGVTG